MLSFMKESLNGEVVDVRLTNKISTHPVFLSTQGVISTQMEKVFNAMPIDNNQKAELILEINESHPIVDKLKKLYDKDKDKLKDYSKILYSEARLIEGLPLDNPTEISNLICDLISK